jgi:hypothetical protein
MATNPAQHLRMIFGRFGVRVRSGGAAFGLRLASVGRGSFLTAVGAVAPRAAANRVSFAHPGVGEWYANGPLGLEQGFTLARRPTGGRGPLTLSLALSGNARSVVGADGRSVLFERSGRRVAAYGDLSASDARGRPLHAWLSIGAGQLLVRVEDRGAVYPLRIDPFVQAAKLTALPSGANLGLSVAASADGSTVAATDDNGSTHQGAVYVFVRPSGGWANGTQAAKLTASDGAELGNSVAVSSDGSTVVAGAQEKTVGSNRAQGAVYVFGKPSSGWTNGTQTARLTASDGGVGNELGWSVGISADGSTIVAGAPGVGDVGDPTFVPPPMITPGAAYVFVRPSSGWANGTQTAKLIASDGVAFDGLGVSVGVSADGSTVAAGAPDATHNGFSGSSSHGAAYVFPKPSGGWGSATATQAKLTASDGAFGDYFGGAVAVSGDGSTVAAGARLAKVGTNTYQGAVYVFGKPSSGWTNGTQTAKLTASDGAAGDWLGSSVAVSSDGSTVAAGALFANLGTRTHQGAVYMFVRPSSGWASGRQTAKLSAADGAAGSELGYGVGVSSNSSIVAAGAPGDHGSRGAVYVFGYTPLFGLRVVTSVVSLAGRVVNGRCVVPTRGNRANKSCVRPVRLRVSYALTSAARVTFTVKRRVPGRLSKGRCVQPTKANHKHRACTRLLAVAGRITVTAKAGSHRFTFKGQIGGKELGPGSYQLLATPTSGGQRNSPSTASFRIVR